MIQIRDGVFETNSSSSHSIVIEKKDKPMPEKVDPGWKVGKDGEMRMWASDLYFGRAPFNLLTDWEGRLCYCIASYNDKPEVIEEIEGICRERIAGFKRFKFDRDESSDKDQPYYGDVDHQSSGLLQRFLLSHNLSLQDFIFNDRYIVVIDGDEYCIFQKFLNTDMFNKDSLIEEEAHG